jgi:hypothetical protein
MAETVTGMVKSVHVGADKTRVVRERLHHKDTGMAFMESNMMIEVV